MQFDKDWYIPEKINHKLIHDSNISGLKDNKIQINYDITLSKVLFLRSPTEKKRNLNIVLLHTLIFILT